MWELVNQSYDLYVLLAHYLGLYNSIRLFQSNISKVCFLMSDSGFLQIFCSCLNVDKIFSCHILSWAVLKLFSGLYGLNLFSNHLP